jgi:hypothetical protein
VLAAGIFPIGRRVLAQAASTRGFARFRSIFALVAGGAALLSADLLTRALWRFLLSGGESRELILSLSFVGLIVPSFAAGWVTAQFAPARPIMHALALGLLFPLLALLPALALLGAGGFAYGLMRLAYLPGILLGALGRRLSGVRPPADPAAADGPLTGYRARPRRRSG